MNDEIKISSNKSFGIVFSVIFLIIALYPLTNNENISKYKVMKNYGINQN